MMLRYAQALTAAATLALCVDAGLAWQRHVQLATAERYGENLRSKVAFEMALTAEVLQTRSGLVAHYDGLVRIGRALQSLQQGLRNTPAFLLPEQRAELLRRLEAMQREGRSTAELVERFKSQNAVLRNSTRFLPVAAAALDAYTAVTPEDRAFKESADALVRDVLLLHSWQEPSILERITRRLDALSTHSPASAAAPQEDLALVLMHAQVVRGRAPLVDELVRRIASRSAVGDAEALIGSYTRYQHAAAARASRDLSVVFVLTLVAVLSGASTVILRMRRSATQLRQTGEQLEQAISALRIEQEKQRELAELKGRFVSMTSHEFRTPLSAILSSSEMLAAYAERWPNEKKAEHFGRIRHAVLGMTRMLDGILLIGKSDAGKLGFNPDTLDLRRFCVEAAETTSQGCKQDHEIVFQGLSGEDVATADEALLRHVVENLLSNAVKYSPRGSKVYFKVWRDGCDVVLEIRDQGIGIPIADHARLFETFHRGSNVGTVSGNGLGLSIVKRAVDLHGGTLAVESEVGAGTRFTVRLPCPRSAA
jgi:signal transduction histidine kinase